jgi:hypothetical protein
MLPGRQAHGLMEIGALWGFRGKAGVTGRWLRTIELRRVAADDV